jgi:hypothetical protein
LPESPKWAAKRAAGTLRRPSIAELFAPALRRTTILTTIMFACSYGVAFGAIQQMPQIVPGIDAVQANAAAAAKSAIENGASPAEAKKAAGKATQETIANYAKAQETGGLFGRFALALIVAHIVSRRALLRMFLVPGLIITPLAFWAFSRLHEKVYWTADMSWLPGLSMLGLCIFAAGFFTVAQFSFWGNYLPHAYPTHLRGTGESFAANIGGRMLGTPFAWVTQHIALYPFVPGASPAAKLAITAAGVALVLSSINLVLSFWLPEQADKSLE